MSDNLLCRVGVYKHLVSNYLIYLIYIGKSFDKSQQIFLNLFLMKNNLNFVLTKVF